jgi:signal recognition particle GTPase
VGAAHLILIEGMIGSGKTTTATRVGDWLARRGENARVFCECAADHPIRTRAEDRLRAAADPQVPGPGGAGNGRAAGSPGAYAAG